MIYAFTNGQDDDFVSLCALLEESLEETVGAALQRSKYKRFNALEKIKDAVVAYNGSEPVACGGFRYFEDSVAEVKRVFVKKEYRGRGISKRLMEMLECRALERGFKTLILETNSLLEPAVRLYEGLGYAVIDSYGPYKEMRESVCMRKEL
jgi:putative acetyltransferase